jgi:hypothetical protein
MWGFRGVMAGTFSVIGPKSFLAGWQQSYLSLLLSDDLVGLKPRWNFGLSACPSGLENMLTGSADGS